MSNTIILLFTNPSALAGYDTRSIFKFNRFEFRVFLLLDKLPHQADGCSLLYYLPIAWRRINGFILFRRVLVLREMQSVSARIWTRIAVSISNDDNHYTSGTWIHILY